MDAGAWVGIASAAVAAIAVVVTVVLWNTERRDRKTESKAAGEERAELQGQVNALQDQQNKILSGIGEGIRAAIDPALRETLGARIALDIEGVRIPAPAKGLSLPISPLRYYLVMRNLGPGTATITGIFAIDADGGETLLIMEGKQALPDGAVELYPGETYYAPLRAGSGIGVDVSIMWEDGQSDHPQTRARRLSLPPV